MTDSDEEVVGIHESGLELVESDNINTGTFKCSNCKRKIHCYVTVDSETKEATIHKTCKTEDCLCKCRTHYACKLCGRLHPYGDKCSNVEGPPKETNPETDALIEKINKAYNDAREAKLVVKKTG